MGYIKGGKRARPDCTPEEGEERNYDEPCPDCGRIHGPEGLSDEQLEAIANEGLEDDGVIRLHEGDGAIILRNSSGLMQALLPPRELLKKDNPRVVKIALGIARMQALFDDDNEDLIEELDRRMKERGRSKIQQLMGKLGLGGDDKMLAEGSVKITEHVDSGDNSEPPQAVKDALQEMARKVAQAMGISDVQLVRVDGKTGDVIESTTMDVEIEGKAAAEEVKPSDNTFTVPGPRTLN
jgi:hypothetical protein